MSGRLVTNSGKSDGAAEPDVPAVAYVRMSTDHQKYCKRCADHTVGA